MTITVVAPKKHDFNKLAQKLLNDPAYVKEAKELVIHAQGGTQNSQQRLGQPPVNTYLCKTCKAPMNKRGAGLGKWHCSKDRSHNHRTKAQELNGQPSNGKIQIVNRTIHQHYGIAVAH